MFTGLEGGLDGRECGHDDADFMTQGRERLGQRSADIGQPARLGERSHFRAEKKDLERL